MGSVTGGGAFTSGDHDSLEAPSSEEVLRWEPAFGGEPNGNEEHSGDMGT